MKYVLLLVAFCRPGTEAQKDEIIYWKSQSEEVVQSGFKLR